MKRNNEFMVRPTHRQIAFFMLLLCTFHHRNGEAFERELQLGTELFYSTNMEADVSSQGGGVSLNGRYGFNDAIALAVEGSWAAHAVEAPETEAELLQLVTGAIGIHYAVDILPVLPYLQILAGASATLGSQGTEARALLDVAVGLDWRIHAAFSLGLELALHLQIGRSIAPPRLCAGLRINWHIPFD